MRAKEFVNEKWSEKYKRSINCAHPKGFSQRAHCQGRKKNEDLNEFAPGGGSDSGDYFRTLASAWYNGVYDAGNLQKGIKSQEDIERLLQRGIVCPDGRTRKYGIDYNSTFDGVVISSDDYYEHSDYNDKGQEVDSRTGQPWGPYDYMEFKDEELDEGIIARTIARGKDWLERTDGNPNPNNLINQKRKEKFDQLKKKNQQQRQPGVAGGLNEFAPPGGDDREFDEEEILRQLAAQWWHGDEDPRAERTLASMGWEIGQDEGYDNGGVFVVRAGDINGRSYISWPAEELEALNEEQLNELMFKGSQCTKDCSGHMAGYEWSIRKAGRVPNSHSPSFNKGAAIQRSGL